MNGILTKQRTQPSIDAFPGISLRRIAAKLNRLLNPQVPRLEIADSPSNLNVIHVFKSGKNRNDEGDYEKK